MTQSLFDQVRNCYEKLTEQFAQSGQATFGSITKPDIYDFGWTSNKFRRAHVSIIDARETKKLYLLHCTVFPHFNDPSPIFGFDIVCGPSKVSGAFLDYSPAGDKDSSMCQWFKSKVSELAWNKPRELPEWAKHIFSPDTVAIGAVGPEELDQFIELGLSTLDAYLDNVGKDQQSGADYHMAQNRYCYYQKQNPRTPTSLMHLGLTEREAIDYVSKMLFPEVS
jgi:hypothetical protein